MPGPPLLPPLLRVPPPPPPPPQAPAPAPVAAPVVPVVVPEPRLPVEEVPEIPVPRLPAASDNVGPVVRADRPELNVPVEVPTATPARVVVNEGVDLVANTIPRYVVMACVIAFVVRDLASAAALAVWRVRWPDYSQPLVDVSTALWDASPVIGVVGWVAAMVWSVIAVVDVRRVGIWKSSVPMVVLAWLIPPAAYLNPWIDLDGPGLTRLVPALLVVLVASRLRTIGRVVLAGEQAFPWWIVSVVWFGLAGGVNAGAALGDSTMERSELLSMVLGSLVVALAAIVWAVATNTLLSGIDSAAASKAAPDLEPVAYFAARQIAAAGADPTAVLNAVRTAELGGLRRRAVSIAPVAWARWLMLGCVITAIVVTSRIGSDLSDWLDDVSNAGNGPLPSMPADVRSGVTTVLLALLFGFAMFVLWGIVVMRNARRLGVRDVPPGRWVLGSVVPIMNLFVPFTMLKDVAKATDGPRTAIGRWQGLALLYVATGFVGNVLRTQVDAGPDGDGIRSVMAFVSFALGAAVVTAGFVTMWFVERAMRRWAAGTPDDAPTTDA